MKILYQETSTRTRSLAAEQRGHSAVTLSSHLYALMMLFVTILGHKLGFVSFNSCSFIEIKNDVITQKMYSFKHKTSGSLQYK